MKIAAIRITRHRIPLDPPFPASWDSVPRRHFGASIIRVTSDDGLVGVGSGDDMAGLEGYFSLFIGRDIADIAHLWGMIDNISFHAGRCWPLEMALWDLLGKAAGKPVWQLLRDRGGAAPEGGRIRAYASTGVHRPTEQMAQQCKKIVELGFPAIKIRFGRPSLDEDLAALAAVRDAVGPSIALMVDCNQGWRMPWDVRKPWDSAYAQDVARALAALDVYWMEEPLHRGDYEGMAALRKKASIRIAGGEMTREPYEFRELIQRGCLDVVQPDCALTGGIHGLAAIAADCAAAGLIFTPHTWGNGIGLMANLQLTAGTTGAPFIELPFDPPEWTAARRDFMLKTPIMADHEGWITLPDTPGLGLDLDEAVLAATEIAALHS